MGPNYCRVSETAGYVKHCRTLSSINAVLRPHKVNFRFLVSVRVDFACGSSFCGNEYKGLGAGWERVRRSGGDFARAQHARGIVYRSLEVADPVIAVCLRPPRDASVSPGVQRSEGAP